MGGSATVVTAVAQIIVKSNKTRAIFESLLGVEQRGWGAAHTRRLKI